MAYPVNLTSRAERDLARIYERINVNDSDAALEWYHGFKQAILSLEKLRHLLYGIPDWTGYRKAWPMPPVCPCYLPLRSGFSL